MTSSRLSKISSRISSQVEVGDVVIIGETTTTVAEATEAGAVPEGAEGGEEGAVAEALIDCLDLEAYDSSDTHTASCNFIGRRAKVGALGV